MKRERRIETPYTWIEPTPVTAFERMLIEDLNGAYHCFIHDGDKRLMDHVVRGLNQCLKLPEATTYQLEFDVAAKTTVCSNEYIRISVRHAEYLDKKNIKVTWLKSQPLP